MSNYVATLMAGVASLSPMTQLQAERITLQNPTATLSQAGGWNASLLTDGITNDYAGWAVYDFARGGAFAETAVMETSTNVGFASGSLLTFVLYHVNHNPQHGLGQFRLSYTTDSRDTFADGQNSNGDVSANWIVLAPKTARSTGGESMAIQADGSILVGGTNPTKTIYTVTAEVMAEGITGFRIEALESPSLPASGPGRYPSNGNFVLTEITADISPLNNPPPPPPPPSDSTKVVLTNAAATFSQQSGWNAALIVDGITNDFAGWAVYDFSRGGAFAETVVVETVENVGYPAGSRLTFNLYHVNHNPRHGLGRFRLSYTTDHRDTFADGLNSGGDVVANWIVLKPLTASATGGESLTIQSDDSILVSGTNPTNTIYTVTAEVNAQDITGFRLEALEDPSLPSSGPGRYPSNGNFVLTELTAHVEPLGPQPIPAPVCLVAWWRGEENANDSIGTKHGTLVGGTTFKNGMVGKSFSFDGSGDSVRFPAGSPLDVGQGGGFTLEGWILPEDLSQLRPIAEWNNGSAGVHFWTGVDTVSINDGIKSLFGNVIDSAGNSHIIRTPANLLGTGVWQHVAISYDKGTGEAALYHNGQQVAQTNLGVFTPKTSGTLTLGNRPSGPFSNIYWKGLQDEISLYDRALTPASLLAIFNAGSAGKIIITNEPVLKEYDLSAGYSTAQNPNGPWSFGWTETLDGVFNLLTYRSNFASENGVALTDWRVSATQIPGVSKVVGAGVAVSAGGAFTAPSGTVYATPGNDGTTRNFATIRFTVPANEDGVYRIESDVKPIFDGPLSGDSDFHVVKNGQELFGTFLPPNTPSGFTNQLALRAGDTIDFVTGRGADGLHADRTALKVRAWLAKTTSLTNPPAPPSAPTPDGVTAWWPLDGDATDRLNRNNGTTTGSPVFASGKVNQAMQFDGGNDSIKVPRSRSINVGLREGFTVEGWIYPQDTTQLRPLAEWNSGNIGVHFWTGVDVATPGDGTRSLFGNIIDTSGISHQIRSEKNLIIGNIWQHVALTYDKASGLAKILHNGQVVAETNLGSFTPDTTGDLYFGSRPSGPFAGIHWKGALDEMTLYRRALDNSALHAIYLAGSSGKLAPTNPPPANTPPVAKALASPLFTVWPEQTNLMVIAVNGYSVPTVLDGTLSSDEDGDSLSFYWTKDDEGSPFAATVITTNFLSAGFHQVTLVVDDGEHNSADTLEIEVITTEDAVSEIYGAINESDLLRKDKRPLFATLDRVLDAFDNWRLEAGIRHLGVFQQKVRAQVAGQNPDLAARLQNAADQIIDAVEAYLESHEAKKKDDGKGDRK